MPDLIEGLDYVEKANGTVFFLFKSLVGLAYYPVNLFDGTMVL